VVVDHSKTSLAQTLFQKKFLEELRAIKSTGYQFDQELVSSMRTQGKDIVEYVLPELNNYFGEYEVVSVEEPIYEPINSFDTNCNFKGFIDLVVKTPDGKHHIIDWKTCSWGWDLKKKSDKLITYQLTLYKNFYSLKYNIDVKDVETHFALLKRTAKKDRVEIFRVTSGAKKMSNALDLLKQAVTNIESGKSYKNRMSCKYCEFYKTEHCR
jgi:ATP-dependent exoDNAse (exonuclease V) beta subunit